MSFDRRVKTGYVTLAQAVGRLSESIGLVAWLDARAAHMRVAHWARSLFSIHDIEALVALDVPWWTYDAIARVEAHLTARPGARVFEWGAGASTVWLARRAGSVHSIEHDAHWGARVARLLETRGFAAGVTLEDVPADPTPDPDPLYRSAKAGERGRSFRAYARAIEGAGGPFDLIVIDGRARAACLAHAIPHLARDGMIVFDNSRRRRYAAGLGESGLTAERLAGLVPSLPYPDETTLLTRAGARIAP